jgi:hypothetical protein
VPGDGLEPPARELAAEAAREAAQGRRAGRPVAGFDLALNQAEGARGVKAVRVDGGDRRVAVPAARSQREGEETGSGDC